MHSAFRPVCLTALPLGLLLAFTAGCSSEPDQPEVPLHAMPDFPPALAGTENFADGKLIVQVTLGLPTHHGKEDGGSGTSTSDSGSSSGTHSGRHGGGGGHGRGGMGGGGDQSASTNGGDSTSGRTPRSGGMGSQPPVQLKLHFQNTSATDAISCEVLDFKSVLGDFAVFPAKYEIAAGQSAVSEIMTSRLGAATDDIPVTVALRIGDHVEKKIITLQLLPTPPPADAPPAPPAK